MERVDDLDKSLDVMSIRIPRWAKDVYTRVGKDTDLDPGTAVRVVLTAVAEILVRNWERGPALGAYLEALNISREQANRKRA